MVSICLSATGRTVGKSVVLKRRSSSPRLVGCYLCSAVALLSDGALILKRHTEGFTRQFKMFPYRGSSVKSCGKDLGSGFRFNSHISQSGKLHFSNPFLLSNFFRTDIAVHYKSLHSLHGLIIFLILMIRMQNVSFYINYVF